MSNINWTKEQSDAINSRDMSIIVSAAAGSGKTAVLVERIVSIVTDKKNPVDIDKLVVVTFSNAAAKEMKHRVTLRLNQMYTESKNTNLLRQITLLRSARISTVHSLCFDLIREHFHELKLPPDVRIGEQREIDIIKSEALEEVIENYYKSGNNTFLQLTELLSTGRDDSGLIKTITGLYEFLRSYPFYTAWLDEMADEYKNVSMPQYSKWGKVIIKETLSKCRYIKELLKSALQVAHEDSIVLSAYSETINLDLDQINLIINALIKEEWEDVYYKINNVKFTSLKQARKCENINIKEMAKGLRDNAKDELKSIKEKELFCTNDNFTKEMDFLVPMINSLFDVIKELDMEFEKRKIEKKLIDFSDLEHYTLKLLINSTVNGYTFTDVAKSYSKGIYQVMVDEYQDTNQVQDMIFDALSDKSLKLFMVGDVKQSIYGFRQARPDIFLEKKKNYPLLHKGNKYGKIIMSDNFRSRKEITQGINFIFKSIMSYDAGGLEYTEEEQLNPSASYPPYNNVGCEMVVIENSEDEESLSAREREAYYIANRIKDMIINNHLVSDKGKLRLSTPNDFAILLRSTTGKAEIYQKALKETGIDSLVNLESGFLTTREISSVLALLKAVDNPLRDLELTAALMSPLFGFTADDIAMISIGAKKLPLFIRISNNIHNHKKSKDFMEIYSILSSSCAILEVSALIYKLYDLTDVEAIYSMTKNGALKVSNLRLFANYAENFDKGGYKGLHSFIRFMSQIEESGSDLSPSALVSESSDAVRIMSIHKSKGLEFPVVFLADTAKKFNNEDLKKNSLIHPELGFASMRKDKELGVMYKTMALSAMKLKIKKENIDEEMRVLYVALTRAKEKLIITSMCKNLDTKLKKLSLQIHINGMVPSGHINSCGSYSDWILSALIHHSDGIMLRDIAQCYSDNVQGGINQFKIELINNVINMEKTQTDGFQSKQEIPTSEYDNIVDEIKCKLKYIYPSLLETTVPTGMAISQIKKDYVDSSYRLFDTVPHFMMEKKLSSAQRGTALHKFMQYASYENASNDLYLECDRMVEMGYLTSIEKKSLDMDSISVFFNSDMYKRICTADKVLREYGFFADVGSEVLRKYTDIVPDGCKVALQGIADCVIIEGDTAIIIDYKTDYTNDEQTLIDRYGIQLSLYKELLGEFLDVSKTKALIYSFCLGRTIVV